MSSNSIIAKQPMPRIVMTATNIFAATLVDLSILPGLWKVMFFHRGGGSVIFTSNSGVFTYPPLFTHTISTHNPLIPLNPLNLSLNFLAPFGTNAGLITFQRV